MKITIILAPLLFAMVFFSGIANAEPSEWQIDPVHSRIFFDIRHIYATVRGQFDDITGTLIFDRDNMSNSRCDMEVRIKSINTNIRQRDDHLLSNEFFSAEEYPVMKFKTTGISSMKGNRFQLMGKLTIKDVTQDVIVPVIYLGEKENPINPRQLVCGFEGKFTIDRLQYHVGAGKYYKMGALDKDVDITITIEALRNK